MYLVIYGIYKPCPLKLKAFLAPFSSNLYNIGLWPLLGHTFIVPELSMQSEITFAVWAKKKVDRMETNSYEQDRET